MNYPMTASRPGGSGWNEEEIAEEKLWNEVCHFAGNNGLT
jgi:hypothetical protein